jgi:iron-sulfur cluster assembly accessory protein
MTESLTLTEKAADRIRHILADSNDGSVFRLAVLGGGCSGFQYEFSIADKAASDDLLVEQSGAKVAVDPASLPFVSGSTLDFVDDLMGQSFKVRNPHATASCGCGTSFSI